MEAESFEDEEIAAFMNAHYVCIKVDREERPDVDAVYMAAVQALTQSGGWPMSVWLTPEREPFFGGTYFPPRDGVRGARRGFLWLLGEVHRSYVEERERVLQAAGALVAAVREQMEAVPEAAAAGGATLPPASVIGETVNVLERVFDRRHGGLRRAPKFPSNVPVRLLLRWHRRTGAESALAMAALTLEKMAAGGLYDQIGGGFHRYSTDAQWLVPHFEKMLYDNALLAVAYAEAFQVTGRRDFARVTRETLDYVLREMTAPEGGFYSATDADSVGPDGRSEEGRFFVWTEAELREALGPGAETEAFLAHYGVTSEGNFEGANILHVPQPDEDAWAAFTPQRAALYDLRALRPAPLRDEKILAAWNGLMISGLAVGGRVLAERRYVEGAARAAAFVIDRMRPEGRLARSYKDGRAHVAGFLDDYAFVAAGLLDLYEATFDPRWLAEALALAEETERRFADPAGGWFMTATDGEKLIAREKPAYDGAEPSGTSVALLNALRLATFTSDDRWRVIAERGFASLARPLGSNPLAVTEALVALDFATDEPREIAVVSPAGAPPSATEPLLAVLRRTFLPNRALAAAAEPDVPALARLAPFVGDKVAVDGRATAYVCVRGRCELPVTDAEALAAQLRAAAPVPEGLTAIAPRERRQRVATSGASRPVQASGSLGPASGSACFRFSCFSSFATESGLNHQVSEGPQPSSGGGDCGTQAVLPSGHLRRTWK